MSVSWSLTAGQLITRAYRLLGYLENPWVPDEDQMAQGMLALNAMLKSLQSDGINLYRQERREIAVPAMTAEIDITPRVMGVEQISWVVQGGSNPYHRPMGEFSWVDYWNLPNPNSNTTSGPSVWMFNRQNTSSSVFIWPLATLGGTMVASVGRTVEDVNDPSDQTDFPDEWTETMEYNLADRLMDDQGVAASDPETARHITNHALVLYRRLSDFDRPTSIWMRPVRLTGSGYGSRRR
jgi:hypothetical protein